MKKLASTLLFIACLAPHTSKAENGDLEAIYKEYETTQKSFKIGMKAVENIKVEYYDDENQLDEVEITSVILKFNDFKAYTYDLEKDLKTGETLNRRVHLVDYSYSPREGKCTYKDIKLLLGLLSYSYECDNSGSEGTTIEKGSVATNLVLPVLCGGMSDSVLLSENHSTGEVERIRYSSVTMCAGVMPVEEVKMIDLKDIMFCDFTATPDVSCEVKDMSFLTSGL